MADAFVPIESEPYHYVNRHRLRFVPPDVMRIWWDGASTLEDFKGILEYGERRMGARKHFVIADFSQATTIEPEARKQAAKDSRVQRIAGTAVIGTTFHVRVILSLIVKAVELIQPGKQGPMRFFETDREAYEWIAQERERLGLQS